LNGRRRTQRGRKYDGPLFRGPRNFNKLFFSMALSAADLDITGRRIDLKAALVMPRPLAVANDHL
jgi:hypothetical protein